MSRESDTVAQKLRSACNHSQIVGALRPLLSRLPRVRKSMRRLFSQCVLVITTSQLWHWVAADPDPRVVEIDLRETKTFQPLIIFSNIIFSHLSSAFYEAKITKISQRILDKIRK
jgi:hypothetical protein